MCHEKRKMTNDGRNRTTKSRKNPNARRKRNFQVFGNIGSRHHQTNGDERKNKKEYLMRTRKQLKTKGLTMSKQVQISHNKIVDVDYAVTERKQLII